MLNKLIKDYDKPERADVRVRVGRFAGFVGIIANFTLFLVKIIFGLISNSISLIADSLNNLSDSGANILVVVGYTISGKPADKDHPYGHARMEYLCSLFISIIIAFLGFEMLTSSISKLITPTESKYSLTTIIVISATILVKIFVGILYIRLGKHINSQSLKASAIDSISDVVATTAVVIGMLLTPIIGPYADGIIGTLISAYIIVMGVKLVIEASNTLLGRAPSKELVQEIVAKVKSYEGVLGIHDLVVHSYGEGRSFASVHVEVDANEDIMKSHDMVDNIEAEVLKEMHINLVIHIDPVSVNDPETRELREKCQGIVEALSREHNSPISLHDFRIVKGITHTNVLFDICVSTELSLTNSQLCEEITESLKQINPLYNLVLTIDRDYFSERYGEE